MDANPERREKAREIARVVRKLRDSDDLVRLVIVTAKDPAAPTPPLTEKVVICDDPAQLARAMQDVRSAYPQVPDLVVEYHPLPLSHLMVYFDIPPWDTDDEYRYAPNPTDSQ